MIFSRTKSVILHSRVAECEINFTHHDEKKLHFHDSTIPTHRPNSFVYQRSEGGG
jgi:hypothetical protein